MFTDLAALTGWTGTGAFALVGDLRSHDPGCGAHALMLGLEAPGEATEGETMSLLDEFLSGFGGKSAATLGRKKGVNSGCFSEYFDDSHLIAP